jgi:two-component system, cell cycle response regulator
MRILIAEDDLTSRAMLSAVLKKAGNEVIETVNGKEAWEELQKPDYPKLVILDFVMPEMDGLEVIRQVRARKYQRPPYIIMLTSKGEKSDIIKGLDAGADDYLTKPFDVGELSARIEVGKRLVNLQAELVESREAIAYQASHDSLTDLLNRRAILSILEELLVRCHEQGKRIAIGMIDIDHFKLINDTYGHQVGDDILVGLAKIFNNSITSIGSVGRFGGEEFLAILPIKMHDDPLLPFNELCKTISSHQFITRSGLVPLTVSIGVTFASQQTTVDELIGAADSALYQAKNKGRNCTVLFNQ